MTTPTDAAIRAYTAGLIRAYAAGLDYLDLAEHMAYDDTIGNVRIADLDGPEIDDMQRRILDAAHAWGADDHAAEPLRPEYGVHVVYADGREYKAVLGDDAGYVRAQIAQFDAQNHAGVVSREPLQRRVSGWTGWNPDA